MNAYLLEGEDMAVLKEAALHFAKSLFVRDQEVWRNRGYESYGEFCDSVAVRLSEESHPDLVVLRPDKPEENPHTISVDNVRQRLTDTVQVRPYEAPYRIYILEHAEMLNIQAQNAILKTLEEPPEYVVILLLAANGDAFLPTILSRVIELKAGERDAGERFRLLWEQTWAQKLGQFLAERRLRNTRELLDLIKLLNDEKAGMDDILSFIEIILRDVLCYKSTRRTELLYTGGSAAESMVVKMGSSMEYEEIGRLTDGLMRAQQGVRLNVNRDLQLEGLLMTR